MSTRSTITVLRHAAVTLTAALGLAAALAVPAHAANRTVDDPRHDAFTLVDLTSMTVKNKTSDLVIEVRAPDFRPAVPAPRSTLITWNELWVSLEFRRGPQPYPGARSWTAELIQADANGPQRIGLSQVGEDESIPRDCDGATFRLESGLLKLVLPQSCFGAYAGTVRASAQLRGAADLPGITGYDYLYQTPTIDYSTRTPWIGRG